MREKLDEQLGNLTVEKIKPKASVTLTILIWTVLIAANGITQINTTLKGAESPGGVIVGHIGLWAVGLALIAALSSLMRGKK